MPWPADYKRFMGSKEWKQLREQHRKRYPFCAQCGVPATDVDHIQPARLYPERRLDPTNLRSLCRDCHSHVRFDQARGFHKQIGLDGWPTDPKHPSNRPSRFKVGGGV
jgi:5-methylcytosine-specific restriction enzyme A